MTADLAVAKRQAQELLDRAAAAKRNTQELLDRAETLQRRLDSRGCWVCSSEQGPMVTMALHDGDRVFVHPSCIEDGRPRPV
jgi:hypothetical protein